MNILNLLAPKIASFNEQNNRFMIRFYTPIILLQAFCIYHAYTRKEEQRWFWIILIFPFIGSLIYLYHTFYNRRNIEGLTESVKSSFVTNYKIDKLEKAVAFSNSVTNRILLADEHLLNGNYERAASLYESCLNGMYKDDSNLLMKLVKVNYLKKDYDQVINYGIKISDKAIFNKSDEKVALAWAFHSKDRNEEALELFEEMDTRFSNYTQRLEFAKYLQQTTRLDLAIEKVETLIGEIDMMDNYEKKLIKKTYRQIKAYHSELSRLK